MIALFWRLLISCAFNWWFENGLRTIANRLQFASIILTVCAYFLRFTSIWKTGLRVVKINKIAFKILTFSATELFQEIKCWLDLAWRVDYTLSAISCVVYLLGEISFPFKGTVTLRNFLSNLSGNGWKFSVASCRGLVFRPCYTTQFSQQLVSQCFSESKTRSEPLLKLP